jgi:hypothetical protein
MTWRCDDGREQRDRSAQRFRDPGFLGMVSPENDAVYLPLKKGRNELMLAVSESRWWMGLVCRLQASRKNRAATRSAPPVP